LPVGETFFYYTQLLSAGGDPRINYKGSSALDIARQKVHAECVRVLEAMT
jgi:hypothetical protein